MRSRNPFKRVLTKLDRPYSWKWLLCVGGAGHALLDLEAATFFVQNLDKLFHKAQFITSNMAYMMLQVGEECRDYNYGMVI